MQSRCEVQTTLKRFRERKDVKTIQRTGRKGIHHVMLTGPLSVSRSERNEKHRLRSVRTSTRYVLHKYQPELLEEGLKGCKDRMKPRVLGANVEKRPQWTKYHSNWTSEQWSKVIWFDEITMR